MKKKEIKARLRKKREELHETVDSFGKIDKKILRKSREMDKLINEYYKSLE